MKSRIKSKSIENLKEKLLDYIKDQSDINRNNKFKCFNAHKHNHNDKSHSASIVPGSDYKYWTCFACGAHGDIFKAVEYKEGINNFYDKVKFVSNKYNIPLEYEDFEIVTNQVYYYKDAEGKVLYKIMRTDKFINGVKDKSFLPVSYVNGVWVNGLKNTKRVLYNLPELVKASKNDAAVYFVEGEKCADALSKLGFCAVTIAGGVNGWDKYLSDYKPYFNNLDVIIIPDNDEPGKRFANKVYKDIKEIAGRVRYMELPELKEKEDIADWISKGGTAEKLMELTECCNEPTYPLQAEEDTENNNDKIFIENNCYLKRVKEGSVDLSNFIIKPIYYIASPEGLSIIRAEIISKEGSRIERTLKVEDFSDVVVFNKTINSFRHIFTGRNEDLQRIKLLICREECESKSLVDFEGFHKIKDKWYFISQDKTIDETMNYVDNLFIASSCKELNTNLLESTIITAEELVPISVPLFRFNDLRITSTIIGYVCGLFLKAKLKSLGIKYNHLIVEGHSGSGKSSTLENVIVPILGMDENILNAGECTNHAINKAAASSNFIPLILDEYKPSSVDIGKTKIISNLMRNSYDSHKGIKGVPDLTKNNKEYVARASMILCGEVGISETANIERSLRVIFSSKDHNKLSRDCMNILKLNKSVLNKLGKSLLKGALEMKEEDIKNIYDAIMDKLIDKSFTNDRVRNSLANCLLGIALLKNVYSELGLDFQKTCEVKISDMKDSIMSAAHEDLLDSCSSSKGVIEYTLETLNRMTAVNQLEKGVDFDTAKSSSGELCLRLNYNQFYDRFLKYCYDYKISHEVLPLASFKKQLQKMDYCLSYNKPVSFKRFGYNSGSHKTSRAAILCIDKLKARDLDIDFLLE